MQRLRIRYRRGEEIKFISHLDIVRLWQRAFTRAGIPLAYSEGFSPHPQITLAAPLAVGVTADAELMDILCSAPVAPHTFEQAVNAQLPAGIAVLEVQPVSLEYPSLPAQMRFAEYRVHIETDKDRAAIEAEVNRLLDLKELPWQHQRDTGPHKYDLRALIDDVRLAEWQPGACTLEMRLRSDPGGSGRPEQVTAALGLPRPVSMHRTRLILKTGG